MNEYIIIIIVAILLRTIAFDSTTENPINVGTVLFSTDDLKNNRWCKQKIGLLRARRYFQGFIPPANLIRTLNEDYIDTLLEYFENGYASIKTEATDVETDKILTVALSDVIGGYLKAWALPVTKFAFYGGTVSQNHAVRLFKFYDELRGYMCTDGEGWISPDSSILSSIDINVAEPKHISNTRRMLDPCDYLAYFVKTPTGLSIPIPYVNWEKQSNTMFVPLKNYSLIPLGSLSSSNALFKYYDAAKKCMQTSTQKDQENFDERFQNWLSMEVVPHLNDDRLYLAFGNILSLVNTSKNVYDTENNIKELLSTNGSNYRNKFSIGGMSIDLTSKKILIITIILFLEVGWCIPALLYILCSKKKKEKSSNVYLFVEPNNNGQNSHKERFKIEKQVKKKRSGKREIYESPSKVEINLAKQYADCGVLKISEMPRHINIATNFSSVSKNSTGTGAQSFYSSKICSTEIARVIYDAPIIAMKPPLKDFIINTTKVDVVNKEHKVPENNHKLCLCTPNESLNQSSFATIQELGSSKTVTLLSKDKSITNEHTPVYNINTPIGHQQPSTSQVTKSVRSKAAPCTCTNCFKEVNKKGKENRISCKSCKTIQKSKTVQACTKDSEIPSKLLNYNMQQTNVNKTKGFKVNTGKPYLEITIEGPQKEMSVDIRSISKDVSPKSIRPSKIPKRAAVVAKAVPQITQKTSKRFHVSPSFKHKSLIPQLKRKVYTVDDIVIKNRDTSTRERKLNVTL